MYAKKIPPPVKILGVPLLNILNNSGRYCLVKHRRRNGRGHGRHGPLTFWPKLFLKIFPFFHKHNLYIESDSPGREEHKSNLIVEELVFARDEIEVSLAPSLLVTFLHPCRENSKKCEVQASFLGIQIYTLSLICLEPM